MLYIKVRRMIQSFYGLRKKCLILSHLRCYYNSMVLFYRVVCFRMKLGSYFFRKKILETHMHLLQLCSKHWNKNANLPSEHSECSQQSREKHTQSSVPCKQWWKTSPGWKVFFFFQAHCRELKTSLTTPLKKAILKLWASV